ncbi:MAG TPA: hypothetical protein VN628_08500 [Vicinamibacterales bacterium]|nr:hypothetical protein [Vicinamibacterales bacterium]
MNHPRLCLTLALAVSAVALATAQRGNTPPVPKMPDGHPDLSGVYQTDARARVGTWEDVNKGIGVAEPAPRPAGAPAPAGPPYQPWAAKLVLDDFNSRNVESATARCIPNFMLLNVGLFPVEFVQTPKKLVILLEYMGLNRNIPIVPAGTPFPDDTEPTFMGTSVGHWDGNTLVVDTRDFNESLHAGGGGGRMHSDALHVTERFTRVDYNTVKWDVVWDDPKVLTRPDQLHTQFMLRPGTRVREYVCQENNQDPATYDAVKKAGDLHLRK